MPAHEHDGVVGPRVRGGGVAAAVFGEEAGREGADARDVAVGVGERGGEGGAEVGGRDEEVVGRGARVVGCDVEDRDAGSFASDINVARAIDTVGLEVMLHPWFGWWQVDMATIDGESVGGGGGRCRRATYPGTRPCGNRASSPPR